MILLTGAGGKTGKAIIKSLSKVEGVCAFVHHEEQIPESKSLGAERVIVGDLRDDATVHPALQDVRAVYHICPNMHPEELGIGKLMIEEAKKAGVEHFVYHSVLHPQTEKMNHHWGKMRVEEEIFESGLPFTILQPAPYMQNLLVYWKGILENGDLRVPYSVHAKFSFIDLEDLAQASQIVLTEPSHRNAVYELAGTEPMSHMEVAGIFGQVFGMDVTAKKETIKDWKLRTGRVSEYALENLVRMFEYYNLWGLAGNPNVLKWVLKREPTSIERFIRRTLKEHEANH